MTRKPLPLLLLAVTVFALGTLLPCHAKCTAIGVGKAASADGTVIVSHTDDAGNDASDLRLVRVPSSNWPRGSLRPVYRTRDGFPRIVSPSRGKGYLPRNGQREYEPLGYIEQANHTYAYWDQDYGVMNEYQLSIAESTCGARTLARPLGEDGGKALLDIAELSKIAMERCKTARQAVQVMGDLGSEHGFYAEAVFADSGEALILADREELWVFHILPTPDGASAIWAAQRVPDDQAVVIANDFIIQEMDLEDRENFMHSANMVSIAVDEGWFDDSGNETFNFFKTFGYEPKEFDPVLGLYSGRRMWRFNSLVNSEYNKSADPYIGYTPSQCEHYPFSLKPDRNISVETLFKVLGDHYEGTEFDLTVGLAAGPFGNPNRFEGHTKGTKALKGGFERPISIYRGTYSFIAQASASHPDYLGVTWYGQDQPAGTVWAPIYAGQESVPESFLWPKQSEFSLDSAWWAFNFVNNWIQLGYSKMVGDVNDARAELQAEAMELHALVVKAVAWIPIKSVAVAVLTRMSNKFIDKLTKSWWQVAFKLVAKYSNGLVTTGEDPGERTGPGYPNWWLKAVGYTNWPPADPGKISSYIH
ncbi:dipeptidase [Chloropicon primus]|uniref:Dipeptidase n=2 Tax=Chloropicon primus TaxID=1764295 RepID=A0A5B8MI15_9CHLO|nr:dipeptidase [Chloropicon primus]UPQ99142.1 dipeptidase [Chloropicon primus]|eukprot:QDZ19931.1 dipeptidase [Chloropicon primus]